jgi:hypothetical protein
MMQNVNTDLERQRWICKGGCRSGSQKRIYRSGYAEVINTEVDMWKYGCESMDEEVKCCYLRIDSY